jgi:hypothetical protein
LGSGHALSLRAISKKISEYISPAEGSFGFAAGVRFTSFNLIDGMALVSISLGTGLEIALLGLARLQIHKESSEAIVHVETTFAKAFLPESRVKSVSVADGLAEEVRTSETTVLVVNPHKLALRCLTCVPIVETPFYSQLQVDLQRDSRRSVEDIDRLSQCLEIAPITQSVPLAVRGCQGLDKSMYLETHPGWQPTPGAGRHPLIPNQRCVPRLRQPLRG